MALNYVQRIRIIMDLLKDGNVTADSAYAAVDLADPALATKYADAVLETWYGYSDEQIAAATNADKAKLVIDMFREQLRNALRQSRAPAAARAASDAEEATVNSEVSTELGAP